MGRISYGVYLYHWPIFVIVDEARTGLERPRPVRAPAGSRRGLAATLSYVLIERPIRVADWRPRPPSRAPLVATSAVAVTAIVVPVTIADDYWRAAPEDIAALVGQRRRVPQRRRSTPLAEIVASTTADTTAGRSGAGRADAPAHDDHVGVGRPATVMTTMPDATGDATGGATGPVRVLMVGDSTAEALGVGLAGWAGANPTLADVRLAVSPGCGFVRGGEVATDGEVPFAERCDEILEHVLPDTLAEFRPEVVMLMSTTA